MATSTGIDIGKKPRTPRCIAAEIVASSSRFDNRATDAFGQNSARNARLTSIAGSVICLSPIFSAIRRISLPENQLRPLVVAISTISNPASSLLRILRMQVRARTCCSMITSTGDFCDTWASSARLVKSSMISPNSECGSVTPPVLISIFHGASLPHTLCSELLLVATLLPTFEPVRSECRRGTFWSVATDPGSGSVVPG